MKIFLTGIRGFLGSHLRTVFEAEGHQVAGPGAAWRLGDPIAMAADTDVLIHCAHNFQEGAGQRNIEGARQLFHAAQGKRRIFLSSHSARPDAVTEYGIAKYRIEQFWQGENAIVVRPGLVIGPGGLYAKQMRLLEKLPIVPLIDGGRDPVAILPLEDFEAAMSKLLTATDATEYNLFVTPMPTMRELVSAAIGKPVFPIPMGVASTVAQVMEKLRIPSPIRLEHLQTLELNRHPVHVSNLSELLPALRHREQ